MSQSLQRWMKFFYLTGSSLKCYSDKSLPWMIFSSSMIGFYILILIFNGIIRMFDSNVPATNKHTQAFLVSIYWANWFGASLIVFFTIAKLKIEAKFWKTVKEVENVFKNEMGVKFAKGNFSKNFGFKIVLLSFLLIFEVPTSFNANGKSVGAFVKVLIFSFVLRTISKTLIIKYIFYVDLMRVCLKNIETELKKSQNSRLVDLKALKKAYKLCWEMSLMIEDIFGWAITSFMFTRLGAFIFNGYKIFLDFSNGNINSVWVITISANLLGIWMVTNSCEKCVESSKSIASLALSINLKQFHKIVGDFALQMLHQKIKFEPKTFFVVSHTLLVTVSIVHYE
jgi:7tm Chemosensory receptor